MLITLDAVTPETEGLGELFALMQFGAVGMMLMSSAVELLLVFIALEISSISTYIMAGFRRKSGKSPESALKYFLLGSFATSFFLYGIALNLRRHRHYPHRRHRRRPLPVRRRAHLAASSSSAWP